MEIHVPELSLVVLIGISSSGKSTFADRAFEPFEVVSSDYCRAVVSGDENSQEASADAFDLLHYIVGKRLARGLLTVVDATNVSREARAQLIAVARAHDVLPVAIVLDTPFEVALARHQARTDRPFGPGPLRRQSRQLLKSLGRLAREGFRSVHVLSSTAEAENAVLVRNRLYSDHRDDHGPFDIIGDVHGCLPELLSLLDRLGYQVSTDQAGRPVNLSHPDARRAVFVGDLVDRGPSSVGVLRLVMGAHEAGHALVVPGNHEARLIRALDGRQVRLAHGLEGTLTELADESEEFRVAAREWCRSLVSHLVLDGGNLIVAHAGLKEAYHGRASGRVRSFALYGDTTGETDEYGLPVRYPWAAEYRGKALVAYGHTPTPTLEWINNTLCLDTGCAFGGHLSALRYPELETVQVPAAEVYFEAVKPFPPAGSSPHRQGGDELRLSDVVGRRTIETAAMGRLTIPADSAAGALEVVSRFALHPSQLPYLPPTMSPVAASQRADYLEHPDEAFIQFARWGVDQVICEEKHMGSRAVIYLTDPEGTDSGAVYTRTGRPFFDADLTRTLLARIRRAAERAGLLAELESDWLLLDAELLPWSAKSMPLLRDHYAPVGAAAELALPAAITALSMAADRGLDVASLAQRTGHRLASARAYDAAWQRYVWPTSDLQGITIAPFQVLAAEGASFANRNHPWHLAIADRLHQADPELFTPTRRLLVDTKDPQSCAAGVHWWAELTEAGGEGMVVKPWANLCRTSKGHLVQPGLKVRGREYLRIIYGPDYTEPQHLDRLRQRTLNRKRALALREYALGLEALDRLIAKRPLWQIHEAVFAVLALESEPVDPRL